MSRIPGLCGVVLAAGQSSRMGTEKALLAWPPNTRGTMLSAGVAALAPFVAATLGVVGKNKARLAPVIGASGAVVVENPNPELGQFSSLRTGLREPVGRGFTAAMICPVDSPPLAEASLARLVEAYARARGEGKWAVAPRNEVGHGHPLIAGMEMIDAFLNAAPESNAKEVRRVHEDRVEYVEIDDPLVGKSVNTPEEYEALCRMLSAPR